MCSCMSHGTGKISGIILQYWSAWNLVYAINARPNPDHTQMLQPNRWGDAWKIAKKLKYFKYVTKLTRRRFLRQLFTNLAENQCVIRVWSDSGTIKKSALTQTSTGWLRKMAASRLTWSELSLQSGWLPIAMTCGNVKALGAQYFSQLNENKNKIIQNSITKGWKITCKINVK